MPVSLFSPHHFIRRWNRRNTILRTAASALRRFGLAVIVAMPALGVAACGHVPLTSLLELRKLDLNTTDPARLKVAVRHPDWLRVIPGGAVLTLRQMTKAGGRIEIDESFHLEQLTDAVPPADLAGESRPGASFSFFRIAEDDLGRLRAAQQRIAAQSEQERAAREGTLSVGVAGCLAGQARGGPVLVSTYLKAAELGRFVPLVRDFDLERSLAQSAKPGSVGRCPQDG